jgi:protein SCO1/2
MHKFISLSQSVFIVILIGLFIAGCTVEPVSTTESKPAHDESGEKSGHQSLMAFEPTAEINKSIQAFQFTDQDGKSFGLEDLKGKVWIADFIFTRCTHVCPQTIPNKLELEKRLTDEGVDVEFVSFSVQPDYDTPSVLKEYGSQYHEDNDSFHYLTGYDFSEIQAFAVDNFGLELKQVGKGVKHGQSFYLLDGNGKVQAEYDGIHPDMDQIVQDIKELQ